MLVDTKVRKLRFTNRLHHLKSDVDMLYIPGKEGDRGLIQLELTFKTTTTGLSRYLESSHNWMLPFARQQGNSKGAHLVSKDSQK